MSTAISDVPAAPEDNNALSAATSTEQQTGLSYDERVQEWVRAIMADRTPVEGGFAPAPIFPVRPAVLDGGAAR